MKLGLFLALAGTALLIGGLIWFFVLPDEKEIGRQEPEEPVPPSGDPNPPESPVDEISEEELPERPEMPAPEQPIPERPELVDDLDLPQRTVNTLKEANIRVVAELENLDGDLENIEGIGPAYAEDIRQALREE
jgi:hypothetical protein